MLHTQWFSKSLWLSVWKLDYNELFCLCVFDLSYQKSKRKKRGSKKNKGTEKEKNKDEGISTCSIIRKVDWNRPTLIEKYCWVVPSLSTKASSSPALNFFRPAPVSVMPSTLAVIGQTVSHNYVRRSRPFPSSLIAHYLLSRLSRLLNH